MLGFLIILRPYYFIKRGHISFSWQCCRRFSTTTPAERAGPQQLLQQHQRPHVLLQRQPFRLRALLRPLRATTAVLRPGAEGAAPLQLQSCRAELVHFNQIRAANRSRPGYAVADKLRSIANCHESLHLREKLLDAAWLPEFEKWESDEESDEVEGDDRDFIADSVDLTEKAIRWLCA